MPVTRMIRAGRSAGPGDPAPPLSAAELAETLGTADATRAGHLLAAAWELVRRYAPDAPDVIAREAVIRCAGWLYEQPAAAVRSEAQGDISTSYAVTHTGSLRHSGAMALLSPWKQRRGGAI